MTIEEEIAEAVNRKLAATNLKFGGAIYALNKERMDREQIARITGGVKVFRSAAEEFGAQLRAMSDSFVKALEAIGRGYRND